MKETKKGFTLIEIVVVVIITAILSAIVMFAVTHYINKGKDANVAGNLTVLVPAGEIWYRANNSYENFCTSQAVSNAISQMPENTQGPCYNKDKNPAGLCCKVSDDYLSWAACAAKFSDPNFAYCVDSRGIKKEIGIKSCNENITSCP